MEAERHDPRRPGAVLPGPLEGKGCGSRAVPALRGRAGTALAPGFGFFFAPGSREHRGLQLCFCVLPILLSPLPLVMSPGWMVLAYSCRVQVANSASKKPDPQVSSAYFIRTVAAVVGGKNVKDLVS